ncbi:MAG TPA: protein-glutamate O-methyltransferase CheR [Steroidobacteraceae bacterium]|jgi:chemotaxis protein methyltransferase CheR
MTIISDQEFGKFQRFIFDAAGITLSDAKKALVSGRLAKRLQACQVGSYGEYFKLLMSGESPAELQMAVDLLTTNETYFFREPKHFQFLKKRLTSGELRGPCRVWSAASSSGQEAYSIGMLLEDCLPGQPWEVVGSDISTRVLQRAQTGQYPLERLDHFPPGYLQRFCLKGRGAQEGTLLVDRCVRSKVRFLQVNLNAPLPASVGTFDVVFLRNVLIYFNVQTKRQVVTRIVQALRPGGWLLIGHSENLVDVNDDLQPIAPAIFRKPPQ